METVSIHNKEDFKEVSINTNYLNSIKDFGLDDLSLLCDTMKLVTIDNEYYFLNNNSKLVFKVFKSLTFHEIHVMLRRLKLKV